MDLITRFGLEKNCFNIIHSPPAEILSHASFESRTVEINPRRSRLNTKSKESSSDADALSRDGNMSTEEERQTILPHASSTSRHGHWYKNTHVVGAVGLVVGVALGRLSVGSNTTASLLSCPDVPSTDGARMVLHSSRVDDDEVRDTAKLVAEELRRDGVRATAKAAIVPHVASRQHPNIVQGLFAVDEEDYMAPMGFGTANDPANCRSFAQSHTSDDDSSYVAWSWVNGESQHVNLRNSCLFYTKMGRFIGHMDKTHLTGCTDMHLSPHFGCESDGRLGQEPSKTDAEEKMKETATRRLPEPEEKERFSLNSVAETDEEKKPKEEENTATLAKHEVSHKLAVDPTRPNIVRGWLGSEVAYETPIGKGKSESPAECRTFAHDNGYVAWGYVRDDPAANKDLRKTCLMFKTIPAFSGNYNDNAHIVGCTNMTLSPVTSCSDEEKPSIPVVHHGASPTSPNIVRGMLPVADVEPTMPLGAGSATNAGICRIYAIEHNHVAFAWVGKDAPNEDMRETCLMYDTIKPFNGDANDKTHITSCTDEKLSPVHGCQAP